MKHIAIKAFALVAVFFVTSCANTKKAAKSKTPTTTAKPEQKPGKDDIKPYDKVITKEAKSDEGLFTVHKIDENYFYEIPDSLFER